MHASVYMRSFISKANQTSRSLLRHPMASSATAVPHHQQHHQQQQHKYSSCNNRSNYNTNTSSTSTSTACSTRIGTKEHVVVIVGATGTGKTKLSIDAASAIDGEIINADKIQLYAGLDITTNKVAAADRRGVRHHLLGDISPDSGELPCSSFRRLATGVITAIAGSRRAPVVAGGSNSLIHALLAQNHNPRIDPFSVPVDCDHRPELRYRCCFLWVDVEEELLAEHLDRRVDEMVEGGTVQELKEYYTETSEMVRKKHVGLGKAIGVPEFGKYFNGECCFVDAVDAIKENTRLLAKAQVRKIRTMADKWGWPLQRLDASGVVRARISGGGGGGKVAETKAWERDVLGPGLSAIKRFLRGCGEDDDVAGERLRRIVRCSGGV